MISHRAQFKFSRHVARAAIDGRRRHRDSLTLLGSATADLWRGYWRDSTLAAIGGAQASVAIGGASAATRSVPAATAPPG
jgi:hypothetical protein